MILIWPFLLGIGKVLLPQLIRTAVPVVASSLVQRFAGGGPPVAPQRAAHFEDEIEEGLEEEFEEDEE